MLLGEAILIFFLSELFLEGEAYPAAEGDPVHPVIFLFLNK